MKLVTRLKVTHFDRSHLTYKKFKKNYFEKKYLDWIVYIYMQFTIT